MSEPRDEIAEILAAAFRRDTDPLAIDNLHSDWAVQSVCRSLASALTDPLAERDRRVAGAAVVEFAHWVAVARAYNGSDREHGQSLYNECLNAVLPTWALEFADRIERGE